MAPRTIRCTANKSVANGAKWKWRPRRERAHPTWMTQAEARHRRLLTRATRSPLADVRVGFIAVVCSTLTGSVMEVASMPLVFRPARADELQRAQELVVRSINDLTERHGFGPMATLRPPDFQPLLLPFPCDFPYAVQRL
jgi:hypothetical protein